jgi:multidrug efflux pump subunit AcrA (membrane-fusion protein)
MKIAAAMVMAAVGVGAAGYVIWAPGSGGSGDLTYQTSQAAVTDVVDQAVADGTIAAAQTYSLSFGAEPTVTSAGSTTATTSGSTSTASGTTSVSWPVTVVNVKVGDQVAAGDVLATADTANAQLQLKIAQATLDAAKAKLKTDKAGADATTRAAARDSVSQAQLQLSQAIQSYSDTKAQNALSVSQAQAAVSKATRQLKSDQDAGADAQTIKADKEALSQAKQNLASTKVRATTSNHQAANQVANARLSLTSAKHNYAKQVAAASDADIATDEAAVASAKVSLAAAQTALAHASISAPVAGRISAVNITPGSVAPSGVAITLQSAELAVTASFTEDDILNLKVGQTASVTVTATGATATGTVAAISTSASGTTGTSVVSYAVTVALDGSATATTGTGSAASATTGGATPSMSPDASAASPSASTSPSASANPSASASPSASATTVQPLPGMSAEVSITISEADNVLAVPAIAVSGTSSTGYSVRVLTSTGTVETRSVQVGLMTDSLAEITSGLTAGESVVTGTSADQVTTTTTTNRNGGFPGVQGGPPGGGLQP